MRGNVSDEEEELLTDKKIDVIYLNSVIVNLMDRSNIINKITLD